jgi:cysteinyl-tRNA synthetase
MSLKIYNTQARQKETFVPLEEGKVKMYVCGPTVYNLVHIGNARPVVVFDTLFRLLKSEYPEVIYARNITDIDDKIMKAAAENNEPIAQLAARYAKEFDADMTQLNAQQPTVVPYATDHVPQMIDMVQRLVDKGHAYAAEGHVLFAVQSMADYGKLSNRSLEDMLDGARVEVAPYKKYAGDFVLWKPSSETEPGWDSPWGYGRPGWHLECSAMIETHLGDTIDIHGGGRDLIFPHHENEVAQSCCAHGGKEYVRYWMHNGYINIGGEKMSKSLGNFRTVRELLTQYKGEVIRCALLSAQYRSEMDFSLELLTETKVRLDAFYKALREVQDVEIIDVDIKDQPFYHALLDDLNTPVALGELRAIARDLNKAEAADKPRLKSLLLKAGEQIGLLQQEPEQWFMQASSGEVSSDDVDALVAERIQAKQDKNYGRADEIRQQLLEQGVILEDSGATTQWRRE